MSCYIRHMKAVLDEVGIEPINKEERKNVDLAIRKAIGKESKDKCNEVWREIKIWLEDPAKKKKLIEDLQNQNIYPI
jgi:hypothetical protein